MLPVRIPDGVPATDKRVGHCELRNQGVFIKEVIMAGGREMAVGSWYNGSKTQLIIQVHLQHR